MRLSQWLRARGFLYPALPVLLAGVLLLTPNVTAQTGQGTLTGTITDSTGAIIPGVSVSIINQANGFAYSAVSNAEGIYRVPYLNAGMYQISY